MTEILLLVMVVLGILNLIRMAIYMVSSDVYAVVNARKGICRKRWHLPTVTVIIPAYNEERTIIRSLSSVIESNYPKAKLKVIVANDGSTDGTHQLVIDYLRQMDSAEVPEVIVMKRPNRGKAAVINYALEHHVTSTIVMCLDSDSALHPDALRNAVQHFRDRNMVALSSNVNIIEDGTLLTLMQRLEYIICYQMKRDQSLLDVEYIVGGIGSMFRMSMLKKVSFYDTNTMTEDIDLTMKIIVNKRKQQRIGYAYDSIVYTEAAHSVKELMKQRFRWKYGRSQTFLKHVRLFFSRDKRHSRRLSWFMLPYALFQDLAFLIEPILIGWILFLAIFLHDTWTLLSAMAVLTAYLLANIWSSQHIAFLQRLRLSYYALPMYFLMYVLSWAEYYALIKAALMSPRLKSSITAKHVTWTSPTRRGSGL